jgi:hypothetical protein
MPPLDLLKNHIGIFDDPQMKELVITPRGVRLVRQIWQAKRAQYAVLRQVEFEEKTLDRDLLASLLKSALEIGRDLSLPTSVSKAA